MKWELDWGKDVDTFEKWKSKGKHVAALENRPELYEDLHEVWEIFWTLNSCRQYGFGPCLFQATEIRTMLELYEIEADETMEYFELLKAMDLTFIGWIGRKNESGNRKDSKG